jgi:hypothetical protein
VTEAESDNEAYRAAVVEHGLFGRARARLFENVWEGQPWRVDLETGFLKIGEHKLRGDILGTHVAEDDSFLWAWANPGAVHWEKSLGAAKQMKALGAKPGHKVFREPSFTGGFVNFVELAYVCGELAGGLPVYPADTGAATAVLLVRGANVDPATIPLIYLPGVLLDFQALGPWDMPLCVRRFLERLGFAPQADGRYTRGAESLAIAFDERGRVTQVSTGS